MKEVKKEEKRNRDERVEKFNQWEGWMSWRQESRLLTWKGLPGTGHTVIRQFAGMGGVGGQTLLLGPYFWTITRDRPWGHVKWATCV